MKECTIEIVRAKPADLEALVPLFDAYRVFYRRPSNPALSRRFIEPRLRKNDSVIFIAKKADAQVHAVGFVQLYPLFSSTSTIPGRLWLLNDLFVDPAARDRGAGRALMERAECFAREDGAVGLTLTTAVDNVVGQKLYESCGYVRDVEFFVYERTL